MIKPLTSLRFIFACMVFVSHLVFLKESTSEVSRSIFKSIFYEGYIGVGFFFILSGFVLAYTYQEVILSGQKSIRDFYIARLARIYPLHLLAFLLSLPLTYNLFLQSKSVWLIIAALNLSLTQSFVPIRTYYFSFNGVSWSISAEMFFYLLTPFLFLLIPKLLGYKKYLPLLLIVLVPLLTFIVPEHYYLDVLYINPFVRIADFIIGIGVYAIYKRFLTKKTNVNFDVIEVSAVLLLFVFFLFHEHIPQVARYSFYYWLPMSYLILVFSFQKGMISKFLSKRIFTYLGERSFGFYMFHYLVMWYFWILNAKFLHIKSDVLIVCIMFAITLVMSHWSFLYVEKPMNRLVKKLFAKKIG